MNLWQENNATASVTYPLSEVLRKATLKVKLHDRGIPMTSDVWGKFPILVGRLRRFKNWKQKGVKQIEVFYEPTYYSRNTHTIELMDPLHMFWVLKYAAIK